MAIAIADKTRDSIIIENSSIGFRTNFRLRTKANKTRNKAEFDSTEYKTMHHRSYETRVLLKILRSSPIDYPEKYT